MTLFTYTVRYDSGAAPNPFGGICTLVICKPAIRRVAEPGDWVIGLGCGEASAKVVYAMEVTRKLTMQEYDDFCRKELPEKIPDWRSGRPERMVGDCIYDFTAGDPPLVRRGVHSEENRKTDLGGRHALLSNHFYYFGNRPRSLPPKLLGIVHSTQGHKSQANAPYAEEFVRWIEGLGLKRNHLYGKPLLIPQVVRRAAPGCRWAQS